MPEAAFVSPRSLEEALGELSVEGAMALGGGTSVGLLLRGGLLQPEKLVWLGRVEGLSGIATTADGTLEVGATATMRDLARSGTVARAAPVLADAASRIGNPRVRAVATLGGALAHADPRQDLPPVLLALRAQVDLATASATRTVPLARFFVGLMETELGEGELATGITIAPRPRRRAAYSRFAPASDDDFATVVVAASLAVGEDGAVEEATLALGGVGPAPLLVADAERLLAGEVPDRSRVDAVAEAAMAAAQPSEDHRGSAAYKRDMVGVWTRRTLLACF